MGRQLGLPQYRRVSNGLSRFGKGPSLGGGGLSPPPHLSDEDGTRWRNELTYGQENHAVDSHYGVAPGVDMAPLRELSNTPTFCGLCGYRHGDSAFVLHQTQNRNSLRRRTPTGFGEQIIVRL
jgi:hypothetical protein